MNHLNYSLAGAARAAIALGLLAGTAAPCLAAPLTNIEVGHYYTNEVVTSLTGSGGPTDAECGEVYQSAGTQVVAITNATIPSSAQFTFDVRFALPESLSSPDLGVIHQSLVQSAGSTLLNQQGNITSYNNGTQAAPPFPYTATLTIFDQRSFGATLTADAPSPTGTGTCIQVLSVTFIKVDPT